MRTQLAPGEVASTCFGANDYSNGMQRDFAPRLLRHFKIPGSPSDMIARVTLEHQTGMINILTSVGAQFRASQHVQNGATRLS